jgi:hypothetical protein
MCELGEEHRDELIVTGESLHLKIAAIADHSTSKEMRWEVREKLSENERCFFHALMP